MIVLLFELSKIPQPKPITVVYIDFDGIILFYWHKYIIYKKYLEQTQLLLFNGSLNFLRMPTLIIIIYLKHCIFLRFTNGKTSDIIIFEQKYYN